MFVSLTTSSERTQKLKQNLVLSCKISFLFIFGEKNHVHTSLEHWNNLCVFTYRTVKGLKYFWTICNIPIAGSLETFMFCSLGILRFHLYNMHTSTIQCCLSRRNDFSQTSQCKNLLNHDQMQVSTSRSRSKADEQRVKSRCTIHKTYLWLLLAEFFWNFLKLWF